MSSPLDGLDDTQSPLERASEILIEVCETIPHYPNLVTITHEKCCNLLVIHASIDGLFTDLEAIHVNNRQNSPGLLGVGIFGSMPSAVDVCLACGWLTVKLYSHGCGPCLSLTITDDNRDNQLWLIHNSTESNSERVSEFTAFVNQTQNLGVDVGGKTTWSGETSNQICKAGFIETVLRKELGKGTLDPQGGKDSRCTVSWQGN